MLIGVNAYMNCLEISKIGEGVKNIAEEAADAFRRG
jgi:hypothetical protein